MSKLTIMSLYDQALMIDVSGCSSFQEAIEQLSSTFLNANQFWQEQAVDLNFGSLLLNKAQAAQIIALVKGVGTQPKHIYARSASTFAVLEELQLSVAKEYADALLSVSVVPEEMPKEIKEQEVEKSIIAVADNQTDDKELDDQKLLLQADASADVMELDTSQDLLNKSLTKEERGEIKKKNPLYLKQTLRAGQAVSHKGDLIIIGDVNAGAEVMAEGDITIWGSLRGIAHAGINGNTNAEIRALRLQPIQIRIANYIARSPDNRTASMNQNSRYVAETAKLVNDKIRIQHKSFDN